MKAIVESQNNDKEGSKRLDTNVLKEEIFGSKMSDNNSEVDYDNNLKIKTPAKKKKQLIKKELEKEVIERLISEFQDRQHSSFHSFKILLKRNFLNFFRNHTLLGIKIGMNIVFTLLVTLCFRQVGYDYVGKQNRIG